MISKRKTALLTLWIALWSNTSSGAGVDQAEPADLIQRLWTESRSPVYQAPSLQQLDQAQALFEQTLRASDPVHHQQAWHKLGFELLPIPPGAPGTGTMFVLREMPGQQRGWGFFLFNPGAPQRWILQAPHSISDLHTGQIAAQLSTSGRFWAGAWNTVPRHYRNPLDPSASADLAHRQDSLLLRFTQAALTVQPQLAVLQLHGFASAKRRTVQAARSAAIISPGQNTRQALSTAFSQCLNDRLAEPILLFPRDTKELGGTTNTIARWLRSQNRSRFVHFEMALDLRQQLRRDSAFRTLLLDCLEQADSAL